MSPLPLPTPSSLLPLTHHQTKRYYGSYPSASPNILGILLGIFIPIFFLALCCSAVSKNNKTERKKRELEESIHRSVRLHAEICRDEGSGCGNGGRELPDSVVAEIVRDVQREMERVQPAVVRGGGGGEGIATGGMEGGVAGSRDGEGSVIAEPPPAYKPRDGN